MSKTVTYADFDLHKVKVGKGLEANFYDRQTPNKEFIVKGNDQPHPDLIDALSSLNESMAASLGILEGWDYAREHNRKNEEALIQAKRRWAEEVFRCKVSGVVFVGEDDTAGLKITGSLECETGTVGMASPTITFLETALGVEQKAKEISENVKKEVWSYLFKNKKAQASLDLESDDEKPKSGLNVA